MSSMGLGSGVDGTSVYLVNMILHSFSKYADLFFNLDYFILTFHKREGFNFRESQGTNVNQHSDIHNIT